MIPGNKPKIIIADDERIGRAVLVALLKDITDQESIHQTRDAYDLIEEVSRHPNDYNIIITDNEMPNQKDLPYKTGIDAIMELRQAGITIPICFTSAYAYRDHELAFSAGANAVLDKPINRMALTTVVQQLLKEPASVISYKG